ncbi:MAG: type transport system permease protein, partial [Acidimicrobiaceae bacterium]|nr:type transport system permease protein [Acidimicrobiaceae bacterium]
MTTTTRSVERVSAGHGGLREAVADGITVTWRNVTAMKRVPEVLVFSTIQPVLFVLMFRYVFGGAIHVPGVRYVDYLMPGIFVQTIAFGAVQTGVGLAEDLGKGLIERFRSLPMSRSAVLAGRTAADLVRNLFVVTLMVAMGFLVGFRVHTNVFAFLAGF